MARVKTFDENETLERAIRLFSCKGYNGTSMQDLVDCLGINRSSMYDTYGDKRNLYIRALELYTEHETNALIDMLENAETPLAGIRKIFDNIVAQSVNDNTKQGCFMVNATMEISTNDKDIDDIVEKNMALIAAAIQRVIEKGQQQGQISTRHSARSLSLFIGNNFNGLRIKGKTTAPRSEYEEVIKVVMSVLE